MAQERKRKGSITWAHPVGEALRARRESITVEYTVAGGIHSYPMSQVDAAARHGRAQSVISEIECALRLKPQDYIAYAHTLDADLEIRFRNNLTGGTEVAFKLTPRKDAP